LPDLNLLPQACLVFDFELSTLKKTLRYLESVKDSTRRVHLLHLLIELRLVFDLLIFTFLLHLLFHLRVRTICQDLSSLSSSTARTSVEADNHLPEEIPNRLNSMSATASTGSPTLRRSVVSRSVSQENVGPSEDQAARLVSSTPT